MGGTSSVQVVMLGLENSGKTTLLYQLKFEQYTGTVSTVGFNCEKIPIRQGKAKGMTFTFWDIGGKDNMRPLWKSYLRSADGVVFVVDSCSDGDGMEEARMELSRVVKCHKPAGVPVLVVANKQDLPEAMDENAVGKALGLHEFKNGKQEGECNILPSCGITGQGLLEIMDCLYDMIVSWKKTRPRS